MSFFILKSISSRMELLNSSTAFRLFLTLLSTLNNETELSFSFLSASSLEDLKPSAKASKSVLIERLNSSAVSLLLSNLESNSVYLLEAISKSFSNFWLTDFSKLSCISTKSFALAKLISSFLITPSILCFCSLTCCEIIVSISLRSSSLIFEPF